MKEKIFLTLVIASLLVSHSFAEKKGTSDKETKQTKLTSKSDKNYRYKLMDKRIKNAIESGLITKEQGDALLTQKKELEDYKKTIWQDDVMTKEEKEKFTLMHKDFKEKMHSVLETAMKKWDGKKQNNNYFHSVVQNSLKNGEITKQQADSLTKKITDLEKLEIEIWSDDKMTKQEHEKLQQTKNSLRQEIKPLLKSSKETMEHPKHMKKMHNCADSECSRQSGKKLMDADEQ